MLQNEFVLQLSRVGTYLWKVVYLYRVCGFWAFKERHHILQADSISKALLSDSKTTGHFLSAEF